MHVVITTRPKFIDIVELNQKGLDTGVVYIWLNYFDGEKGEMHL